MRDTPGTRSCTQRIAAVVLLLFAAYTMVSAVINFLFNTFNGRCVLIGATVLFIWIDRRLRHVLAKDHVYERWDTVITGAAGMGNDLIQRVEEQLSEIGAPDIRVERKVMVPGLFQGVMGERGLFLVVSDTANRRLRLHRVYIGTEEYGKRLHVFWYLARHPGFFSRVNAVIARVPILSGISAPQPSFGQYAMSKESATLGLDVFDEQELKSFVSNAHHCLIQSVEDMARKRDLDTSGIDTRSKGFLGIS